MEGKMMWLKYLTAILTKGRSAGTPDMQVRMPQPILRLTYDYRFLHAASSRRESSCQMHCIKATIHHGWLKPQNRD